jgi:hypothetical protein
VKSPFDAHEKESQVMILVLIGMQNVGASFVEQAGDAGHQTLAVRTINQQNGRIVHPFLSLRHPVDPFRPKQKAPEQITAPAMRVQRNELFAEAAR